MNTQPSIAIVLLNYNGRSLLEKNLPHILSTTYSNKEVVVIDNGSNDDSVTFLKQSYPQVRLIQLEKNFGYAGGYNRGLKELTHDFYLLINTDVRVSREFIEPLIGKFLNNPGIAVCQPRILCEEEPGYFEYAGAAGGLIDRFGYTFARGRVFDELEKDLGQYEEDAQLFWASGACLAIRSSTYRQLSGFYEYFFMYSEEVDLCWRTQLAGHEVVYCHQSVVYHQKTTPLTKTGGQRVFWIFRNNLVMLWRNLTPKDQWKIIPARIVLNMIAALYFLFCGRGKSGWLVFKSVFAAIKWRLRTGSNVAIKRKPLSALKGVYWGSIVWDHYRHGKKTYSELQTLRGNSSNRPSTSH
jgi:GT2 family glycosyltransferase